MHRRYGLLSLKDNLTLYLLNVDNAYYNKVILMGNVGKDPEFFMSKSVKPEDGQDVRGLWTFTLATSRYIKKGEEYVQETQWHSIKTVSTSQSPLFARLTKGAHVTVEGRIEYKRDEEKERTYTSIYAGMIISMSNED
ncbi:hypothetical protein HDU97_009502 [Phlyctochytrium planicorne]|nr:hypothetical protein HDU97_009502 [Phlyctochytrium planicorne]